ncbi:MAG TPA: 5'-3' exonuclease H3TH domain-containing protein, partial [Rhodocyclaceae bacterium]
MSAGTLLLVDGSSYLYRAYHALPDLRSPAGLPTGAVYGVLSMLRRMPGDFKATHCACVFDAKGKTFRDDWYADYKANRPPMPDDLVRQIEPLHEAVRALGWPLLCETGVEADDVIGTLARQAAAAGFEVIISTGDKDLAQLVTPQITLINTMTNERLDVAGVQQKFGVPPERIVDYLSLIGDSVDNVPGVDKVGPKTAVKWLDAYGSLDAIVAAADEIGGKVGENLRAARDFLPLGRKLVTVVCDLDLPVRPEQLAVGEPDVAALRTIYEAQGFRSWLKALNDPEGAKGEAKPVAAAADAPAPAALDASGKHREAYATVLDEGAFANWMQRIEAADAVAFDSET